MCNAPCQVCKDEGATAAALKELSLGEETNTNLDVTGERGEVSQRRKGCPA